MKRSAVLGSVGLVLAFLGALLWQSFDTPAWTALDIGGPNYPTVVIIATCAFFLIHAVRVIVRQKPADEGSDVARPPAPTAKMTAFVALWMAYILILPVLGFTVASILAVTASVLLQERLNPVVVFLSSTVAVLVMVVVFRRFLYVATPQGAVDRWIETTLYGLGI